MGSRGWVGEWLGLVMRSRSTDPKTRKVPRIEAIMGECFGEPSWNAAWSDFTVMVKGTAMGAAGPKMLEKAIGQKITPQELAGWEIQSKVTGQADAISLGLARALAAYDEDQRPTLRSKGLLTRDSRKVERKKPGRPKARKRFQFSKR